ncbi:NAD(P)H-binding protein [Tunturiibacter psychrotolerans]|uniref:NAD(P)H-binding protein n=1 Tax=Tunturiibacter psychrotolerans TaxID=3069686 RepID=UPI00333F176D
MHIPELMGAGYTVLGLTRSEEGAKKLQASGVEVHHGNIEDLDSLRKGAENADGVIHCAMNHDFSQFVKNCEDDKNAIIAMGEVLVGSKRPFLVTSGTGVGSNGPGKLATEDQFDTEHPNPRIGSELAGAAASEKGVSVSVIRLPQVHDGETRTGDVHDRDRAGEGFYGVSRRGQELLASGACERCGATISFGVREECGGQPV